MVQKRRERTLRGGCDAPPEETPTAPAPLTAPTPDRRRRDRVVALGAVASLVAVAGIAGWRLIEGDSDAAWAAQAQERLGSVDQQLSLLAQTTQQWQTQPAAVIAQRPDVAAILLQREQELARERADLTVGLARYQQLPVMRAREADDDARAQALQWQLDAQAGGGDPAGRDQLAAQLDAVSRPGTPEAGPKCKVAGRRVEPEC
ncbi:MAG: hypothetical protein H0V92_06590 [Pseudonocardiales bacterium]|nr:hypothetical protein [Pseudonocardiales bacterium]